jgi:uncharacterized membrane protein YphA (DoxX/SURF4 family)
MGPDVLGAVAGAVVGLVLVAAGVAKASRPSQWAQDARALGVEPPLSTVVAPMEILLGALLLVGVAPPWPALAAFGALGVFTIVLLRVVGREDAPACACFGGVSRRPVGVGHIVRNAALMVLALASALMT